jgi:hypothetical protein
MPISFETHEQGLNNNSISEGAILPGLGDIFRALLKLQIGEVCSNLYQAHTVSTVQMEWSRRANPAQ